MDEIVSKPKLFIFGKNGAICKSVIDPKTGKSRAPSTLDLQEYWEDTVSVIDKLKSEGNVIALFSNEGGVAFSIFSEFDADLLVKTAAIFISADSYRMCPFHPNGKVAQYAIDSPDRLPAPGMILSLMGEFGFSPQDTIVVGDWAFEQEAAEAAGCQFIWASEFFQRGDDFTDRMHEAMGKFK